MTISEKILARASDRKEIYPYEMLEARVDMTLSHEKTGPPFFEVFDGLGIPIWDGEKVAIFSDHDDLAYELAPYGINVNAIPRGYLDSSLKIPGHTGPDRKRGSSNSGRKAMWP